LTMGEMWQDMGWMVVAVLGYLIPSITAMAREHRNAAAIAALNVLLGWTVLGWIGALVWALTEPKGQAKA